MRSPFLTWLSSSRRVPSSASFAPLLVLVVVLCACSSSTSDLATTPLAEAEVLDRLADEGFDCPEFGREGTRGWRLCADVGYQMTIFEDARDDDHFEIVEFDKECRDTVIGYRVLLVGGGSLTVLVDLGGPRNAAERLPDALGAGEVLRCRDYGELTDSGEVDRASTEAVAQTLRRAGFECETISSPDPFTAMCESDPPSGYVVAFVNAQAAQAPERSRYLRMTAICEEYLAGFRFMTSDGAAAEVLVSDAALVEDVLGLTVVIGGGEASECGSATA